MKKLMYIVFFLLMAANLLAQETYVIDSVCVGAERTYRRDGEANYSYYWELVDREVNDTSYVPGVDFKDINGTDTTWGNEITHLWDAEGEFDIIVYVTTEHGCDTLEQGMVKVFPLPEAEAGEDRVLCDLNDIAVSGDTAWNHSVLYWATTGDGTLTALTLCNEVVNSGKSLKELASDFPQLPQTLINVPNVDKLAAKTNAKVQAAVEREEKMLGDTGRVLLRPSGTEPLVRVMAEAETQQQADEVCDRLAKVVAEELAL